MSKASYDKSIRKSIINAFATLEHHMKTDIDEVKIQLVNLMLALRALVNGIPDMTLISPEQERKYKYLKKEIDLLFITLESRKENELTKINNKKKGN